jgi:hypothetical protein
LRVSLSVVCTERKPPGQAAAIIRLLRHVADEIVVAVEAGATAAELQAYAADADRIVHVPDEAAPTAGLAHLHSVCTCDWILRIDGDEVPSAALVDALPALVARDDVLQYRIPRRWLVPPGDHWLAAHPWWPDYQVRLVRNDPATLRFRGAPAAAAEAVLPARYTEEPLYCLGLLTGRAEHGPTPPELAPVPEADRTILAPILAALARQTTEDHRRLVDDAAEHTWAPQPLAEEAYRAEIVPLQHRLTLAPGEDRVLPVRIVNLGTEVWPWGDLEPRIRLAYRTDAGIEGPRTLLSANVRPGDSTVLPVRLSAPSAPGRHSIDLDLVHELVRWFDCAVRVEVEVVAERDPRSPARPPAGVVCVTGMHRSGTSLVARVLNLIGVYLGPEDELVAAGPDNELGFWENAAIVRLNDEILATFGGSALEPPLLPDEWEKRPELEDLRHRAEQLIGRTLADGGPVGWKDPRTSLTLPFWRAVVPVTASLLCLRDPVEVARSLSVRQGMDEETAARLWLIYCISAYRADPRRLVVRYDEFFDDHEAAARRIAAFLGLPEPSPSTLADIGSFVEWRLRHHRAEANGGRPVTGTMALARSLYRVLATAPAEAGPLVDLLHRQVLEAQQP